LAQIAISLSEYAHKEYPDLLLAIFLVSVLALEAILRHDEEVERKRKKALIPPTRPTESSAPDSAGVLILAQAIEHHRQEAKRPAKTPQPAPATSSLDSSLQEASGPLK
jgi:hypothetical protein